LNSNITASYRITNTYEHIEGKRNKGKEAPKVGFSAVVPTLKISTTNLD